MRLSNKFKFIIFCALYCLYVFTGVGQEVSTFIGFATDTDPGCQMADPSALTVLFANEYIKRFNFEGTWLARIRDKSIWADYNTIHMAALGARPEVLVNNVTYPIESVRFSDTDVVLNMDKFDTKNTDIYDDDLFSNDLDKIGETMGDHATSTVRKMATKGLHAIAPTAFDSKNFAQDTTGAVRNGFKQFLFSDLVLLRENLFKAEATGDSDLNVVLCPRHEADLLLQDNGFKDKYSNTKTGEIFDWMGFVFHKDTYTTTYTAAGTAKRAYGAVAVAGDRDASVVFPESRVVKAMGGSKTYLKKSEDDPEYRATKVGMRRYGIILPTALEGFGAILSKA